MMLEAYLWITAISFILGLIGCIFSFTNWMNERSAKIRYGQTEKEKAKAVATAAADFSSALKVTFLVWLWPLALPVSLVYGLYKGYKAYQHDINGGTE